MTINDFPWMRKSVAELLPRPISTCDYFLVQRNSLPEETLQRRAAPPRWTTGLVTGASSGIGYEFARQLAAKGSDLVLVSRDRDPLNSAATKLHREYGVRTEVVVADLSDRSQTELVAHRLTDQVHPVDLLVNNAGGGENRPFLVNDVETEQTMFDLMGGAVLTLSHAAGEAMTARGRGAIVNVSSFSSYLTLGTYSATKAWVRVFSEGLAAELAGTGVTCTAVCPGFTKTPMHERPGTPGPNLPAPMWLHPPTVVRRALDDAARGQVVSIPGVQYRLLAAVVDTVPRPVVRRISAAMVAGQRPHQSTSPPIDAAPEGARP